MKMEYTPFWLAPHKRDNITHTYTRHHWRSKIETTTNTNEQEEVESSNVSESSDANEVSDDEQVCWLSAFAPTSSSYGHRKKLGDVPAPETPDIVARKHGKRMSPMDSEKRTCHRSLNLDTTNLERGAQNDSMLEQETEKTNEQETEERETEDHNQVRALLVYRKRKRVNNEGEKESFDRKIGLFLTRVRDKQAYTMHHWRSKIEATTNTNEQEEVESSNVSESSDANDVSDDEQICWLSPFAPTSSSYGHREKLGDVPAPETADIVARKHGAQNDSMLEQETGETKEQESEDHNQVRTLLVYRKRKRANNEGGKESFYRKIDIVARKHGAQNDSMLEQETEETKEQETEDHNQVRTLLVYRKRKRANNEGEKESFDRKIDIVARKHGAQNDSMLEQETEETKEQETEDHNQVRTLLVYQKRKRAKNEAYARHHCRNKIETTTDTNEQEEVESSNVSESSDANDVSGDEQVCWPSPFAPTSSSYGHREKLGDIPAPETPDIVARKHGKRMLPMDSEKRTCRRSLNLDATDLERGAQNDSLFEQETEDHNQVQTFVYRKRKRVENEVKEEGHCWKEGEKESFSRKIDLFLTRMRNTQGEREFSEWRGSVMDSIVGVYLAQNVNDILSSSAFMSLAAKFPVGASSPIKTRRKHSILKSTRQRSKTKHDPLLLNALKDYSSKYHSGKKTLGTSETVDWDSVRTASVRDISKAIQIRGMNHNLSVRIKACLNHLVENFGNTDMEWIRDVPPRKAKEYLMSIFGLGLKSVECIRLLTLRQKAFPIDRNAGRVAIRLGWVTLKQLRGGKRIVEGQSKWNSVQRHLWPRLSHLEWSTQYEAHCHLITFGKVFCTEKDPNCLECPMKAECMYFASVEARKYSGEGDSTGLADMDLEDYRHGRYRTRFLASKRGIIPVVKTKKKLKTSLRTEHQVYVLPKSHDLLSQLESRELDESCPNLLAVWTENLKKDEEDAVYGTFLIPARAATRGTFPLNGTFFQANEVFADDKSSKVPIRVPKASLTNLLSATLYCGKSMTSICKGMTSAEVKKCFKRGFVCLRGIDLKRREPKPLSKRFHG